METDGVIMSIFPTRQVKLYSTILLVKQLVS